MALCVVDAATTEHCNLMKILDIWKGGEPEMVLANADMDPKLLERALMTKLHKANEYVGLELCLPPPPEDFVLKFMTHIGGLPCVPRWNEQIRVLAQKIMHAALVQLAQGCIVYSRHLSQSCADFCGVVPTYFVAQSGTYLDELAFPTLQAMSFLVAEGVLMVHEVIVDCEHDDSLQGRVVPQKAFVQVDTAESMSALVCLCRLLEPAWDALELCCSHHSGPWHRRRQQPVRPVSGSPLSDLLLKENGLHISGSVLAQLGRGRTSLSVSKHCDTNGTGSCVGTGLRRSASTTRTERPRRRSTPVLWSAEVENKNRSRFTNSVQLCLGNAS